MNFKEIQLTKPKENRSKTDKQTVKLARRLISKRNQICAYINLKGDSFAMRQRQEFVATRDS